MDYNNNYYEEHEVRNIEDLSKLRYNVFKAIKDIRDIKINLCYCIKDYNIADNINNFIERLDLDELYGFIYRKLWRAADDETKNQYDTLFKLLNGDHTKTVLAIQTGLMEDIMKGKDNASK